MSSSETQKPTSTLISVIIPAYNVAEKLPETLDSLASQSAKDDPRFEFIIVDDGSRDNTLEVAKSYAASDPASASFIRKTAAAVLPAIMALRQRAAPGSGSSMATTS